MTREIIMKSHKKKKIEDKKKKSRISTIDEKN